jgi:hypothetical protein
MRHVAFILLSVVLVITGTAELALGLDGFLFGGAGAGLSGYLMVGGGWISGTCSIALAEEAAEAMLPRPEGIIRKRNRTVRLPCVRVARC